MMLCLWEAWGLSPMGPTLNSALSQKTNDGTSGMASSIAANSEDVHVSKWITLLLPKL